MTNLLEHPSGSSGLGERAAVGAFRSIGVIAQRDLIRQLRNPGMLATQAMQMVFVVVVFGVGFNSMIAPDGGLPFSAYVFPGVIAIQIVTVAINSGLGYAWDREFGVLREMQVAPTPKVCLPAGKVVATGIIVCVQSAIMLLLSPLLSVPLTLLGFLGATLAYTVAGMVFSAIGLFLATAIRRVQTLQSSVALLMFPMLFLSGAVFRPEQLPGWLTAVVAVNPMSYAVDLVRHVLLNAAGEQVPGGGQAHPLFDLVLLLAFGAVAGIAVRLRVGR